LVAKNLVKIWFEKIWLKTHIGSATHWRPGEQMFQTDVRMFKQVFQTNIQKQQNNG
jgi:hypothetical protein